MELGAGEDSGGAGLGHGDQEGAWGDTRRGPGWPGGAPVGAPRRSPVGLTLRAIAAVVPARPGWRPGAGAVVPGPALRVVPRAQARLEVGGRVAACGEAGSGCRQGPYPACPAPARSLVTPSSPSGSRQAGVSSSEPSPQLSSPSHSWWGSTQAMFPQWWYPRGQRAWGADVGEGQPVTVTPRPRGPGQLGERLKAIWVLLTHCPPGVGPRHGGLLTGQPTAPEDHVVQGHGAPVGGISGGREGHLKRVGSSGLKSGLRPSLLPPHPDHPQLTQKSPRMRPVATTSSCQPGPQGPELCHRVSVSALWVSSSRSSATSVSGGRGVLGRLGPRCFPQPAGWALP